MFDRMKRVKQELSEKECIDILNNQTHGVLSVNSNEGYPYTVPLNYVYYNNKIYFHCGRKGLKIDCIRNNNKVAFCVIDLAKLVHEDYSTTYKSVNVFGKAKELTDKDEIFKIMQEINFHLFNSRNERDDKEISDSINHLNLIEIEIDLMTGKKSKSLVK